MMATMMMMMSMKILMRIQSRKIGTRRMGRELCTGLNTINSQSPDIQFESKMDRWQMMDGWMAKLAIK